jgi:hypothetical protein
MNLHRIPRLNTYTGEAAKEGKDAIPVKEMAKFLTIVLIDKNKKEEQK